MDAQLTEREFSHHNEVVRNYWIHTGLLLPNIDRKRSYYEWPIHSGKCFSHEPWGYIGNPQIFGPLHLLVHEENFPGMIIRAETLIQQGASPTLHYLMGGTRAGEYPMAVNYQVQGCGPLPDNCTLEQWVRIVNQSMETWYLGKKGGYALWLPKGNMHHSA